MDNHYRKKLNGVGKDLEMLQTIFFHTLFSYALTWEKDE
jgi:hypothetical protein